MVYVRDDAAPTGGGDATTIPSVEGGRVGTDARPIATDGGAARSLVLYYAAITSRTSFTDIASADEYCDTNKPNAGGIVTAKALLTGSSRRACSTPNCLGGELSAEQQDWPLRPNTTYVRSDGTTIIGTTNESALFDDLNAAIVDTGGGSVQAWTGLNGAAGGWTDWTTAANCSDWGDTTGALVGWAGRPNTLDAAFASSQPNCGFGLGLYCVELPP